MEGNCDQEVYESGTVIAVLIDVAGEIVELWCKLIAKESGQRVDWHYVGGRAVIKALGDIKKVESVIFPAYSAEPDRVAYLGGAKSCYGYYPNGSKRD